jgi:hypothetical protein
MKAGSYSDTDWYSSFLRVMASDPIFFKNCSSRILNIRWIKKHLDSGAQRSLTIRVHICRNKEIRGKWKELQVHP